MLLSELFHALISFRIFFILTELSQQRIGLTYIRISGISDFLNIIGSNRISGSSQYIISGNQLLIDFRQLISFPEFQVSATLKQLTNTFRFFHTRQLNQDTTRCLQTLDVRRNHTETVDTSTQYVE